MMANRKERVMVDLADLVAEVDQYPEAAGVDADVWRELSYTQKLKILVRRQIASVQKDVDEMNRDD